jgi:hypothetical protein
MISSFLPKKPNAYQVIRTPWSIFDDPAAAALTPLGALPGQDVRIQATVSGGAHNTGSLTVSGALDGVAVDPETLDFDGSRDILQGTYLFNPITGITTTGLADENPKPNILIECLDSGGAPIMAEALTPITVSLEPHTSRYQVSEGVFGVTDYRAFTKAPLEVGDVIRYGGMNLTVKRVGGRNMLGNRELYRTVYL